MSLRRFWNRTPDIFGHLMALWFFDSHPGVLGYRYHFRLLALVALAGLAAVLAIRSLATGPAQRVEMGNAAPPPVAGINASRQVSRSMRR